MRQRSRHRVIKLFILFFFFFLNDPPPPESSSLPLHAALPIPWRTLLFIACATLPAIAVVSAGTVGFVGLITPHAVRLMFRSSDHRVVAPAAALAGGMVLAAADLVARTVASPRQLPVGAIMALVGAPLFVALLRGRGR